jgi:hypothetical protein
MAKVAQVEIQQDNKYISRRGTQMTVKHSVCAFLLAIACFSLMASAQDSAQVNITGGGTVGRVPLYTGAHKIGDSIMKQGGGAISVGGGLNATRHATSSANGVFGNNLQTDSLPAGAGTFGELSTTGESTVGSGWANGGAGAWGDGGGNDASSGLANYGVLGTSDNKAAGIFDNNGPSYYTLFGFNFATGSTGFPWAAFNGDGSGCSIDTVGDLSCNGVKNAVVPIDGGKHQVGLAAIESPNVWFEDFGSAQLSGGLAVIRLDAKFIQTVNTKQEYHVFLTPNGDCKGLYVHQKNADSFEVRELGSGSSNVRFDYRITALRKGYEKARFVEHGREFPASRDGRVRPPTK